MVNVSVLICIVKNFQMFFIFQLLNCPDNDLLKFMDSEESCNISELLLAGGFPHIEVSPASRLLAYECVLTSEVITKRVPVLDDIRNGLKLEYVMGGNLLDIARLHEEVKKLVFPEADARINLQDLQQLIRYDVAEDDIKTSSKNFMERYLKDLDLRGKVTIKYHCIIQRLTEYRNLKQGFFVES